MQYPCNKTLDAVTHLLCNGYRAKACQTFPSYLTVLDPKKKDWVLLHHSEVADFVEIRTLIKSA